MNMPTRLLFLLLIAPVLSLSALDFTAIVFVGKKVTEPLYYQVDDGFEKIVLRERRRSLPCSARLGESNVLSLYVKNPSDAPEAPPYLPVAQATIRPESKRVLVLINLDEKTGGAGYHIKVIEENVDSFPPGSFRFLNLSGQKLGIVLGEEKMIVPDNTMRTLEAKKQQGNYVSIKLVSKSGYLYQSTWYVSDHIRELVIIFPGEEADRIRLSMFSENVP